MDDLRERLAARTKPISFKATLSLTSATTIGLGSLMGAGLYVLVGLGAAAAGPSLWLAYALCGGLTFLSAYVFADLATRNPLSVGAYVYVYEELGSLWGFFVGWLLAVGSIFACALYAIGLAQYLAALVLPDASPTTTSILGAVTVLVLAWVGSLGGQGAERIQRVLTWGNLLVLLAVDAIAVPLLAGGHCAAALANGFDGVTAALSLVDIAFVGCQLLAGSAEAIEVAAQTVPKVMRLS